ncbi:RecQ family ATP-dependent DNA helicase [Aneurinibacillus terranovensis]|uniref:RecQ family ATP-dependent DNA helicase n=1 Tax=Aneurinibacillus terranovensis TaxID=278991 RepID=UPI0004240B92|nr:ATP-dependent DNA helicase RecQ [Aneurinibacillus terranovensis]
MMKETVKKALEHYFSYREFRPGQREIIEYALRGESVLGILATGGGKSLCYQLPALLFPYMTVVVSPLISLMADQVRQLRSKGIGGIEYINSALAPEEYKWKMKKLRDRKIKILYVSPEKLQQDSFMQQLAGIPVSLFVVDEAHCISQWGHDFRTDYQRLKDCIHRLGDPPVMALTATATSDVQKDICLQLGVPAAHTVKHSLNRSNICYDVQFVGDKKEKDEVLLYKLGSLQGPGLVYFRSRNGAERACALAEQAGISCAYYHGGMPASDRLLVQQQFLNGEITLVFATNAFGMGIDKSDIRFVIHYHLPTDMESYLQEVGRVGRDGAPGYTCLLYMPEDMALPRQLIAEEYPDITQTRDFVHYIAGHQGNISTVQSIAALEEWGLNELHLGILLYHMEKGGWIRSLERTKDGWTFGVADRISGNYQNLFDIMMKRRELRYGRLKEMERWIESRTCRRRQIGDYFSQSHSGSLASCCDRCGIDYSLYEVQPASAIPHTDQAVWDWERELDRLLPL